MINCPYCGKLTDPKLDNCPHCGGYMRRGAAPAKGANSGQRQTCPNCHALVQDGDIICVNCGTNLLTGQKITEEKKVMARKKRRTPLWVWLAIVGGVLLVAILALVLMTAERDPVARAESLIRNNQLSEATAVLSDHVKRNPRDASAQYQLGQLYYRLEQYSAAAAAFRAAAKADNNNREAYMLAVASLASSGDAASSRQVVDVLKDVVDAYPNDQEALFLLGMARGAIGDYKGQVDALRAAVKADPSLAEGHQYLGLAMAIQGLYPEAKQELDLALTSQPDDSDIKAAKAFVGGVLNEGAASEQLLREAVEQRTSVQGLALTQLGLSLVSRGEFQAALDYLEDARAVGSQPDTARLFYGIALAAVGRFDNALSEFNELAEKKGGVAADAMTLAAQVHLAKGDAATAREAIDRAQSMGAQGARFLTTKGRVYAASGDDATAREAFKSALNSDKTYPPAWLEYGLFHITKEQAFPEGIQKLKQYLALLEPGELQTYGKPIQDLVQQLEQTGGGQPGVPAEQVATSGMMS